MDPRNAQMQQNETNKARHDGYNTSEFDAAETNNNEVKNKLDNTWINDPPEMKYLLRNETVEVRNNAVVYRGGLSGDVIYPERNRETKNDVALPGSAIKPQSAAYHPQNYTSPSSRAPLSDALNTVGIPVYSNNNYLYANNRSTATNHQSHPLSPSNYPTMVMGPVHPGPAVLLESDLGQSRPPTLPVIGHVIIAANPKRTKHLKPPSNNKLKSKLVPVHHITPSSYPVQSTSQSSLFHAPSNYALPASPSQVQHHPLAPASQSYAPPPTAPTLYEEEPSPLGANGVPSPYATIDPKKLRTRHIRPAVFKRRGVGGRQYQLL